MRRDWQQSESKNYYRLPGSGDDLVFAFFVILVIVLLAWFTGCASAKGIEPKWGPEIFLYSPTNSGECYLMSDMGFKISCTEPLMHEMVCMNLDDLSRLKRKHLRCKRW